MPEQFTGTVDRIVNGQTAVILLEADDEVVDQLNVDVDRLPDEGQQAGAVLEITIEHGKYVSATYVSDETDDRKEAARDRLGRLSEPLSERDSEN